MVISPYPLCSFRDNVLPVGKQYVPLTPEQRRAVTLDAATEAVVRDARVANETLIGSGEYRLRIRHP